VERKRRARVENLARRRNVGTGIRILKKICLVVRLDRAVHLSLVLGVKAVEGSTVNRNLDEAPVNVVTKAARGAAQSIAEARVRSGMSLLAALAVALDMGQAREGTKGAKGAVGVVLAHTALQPTMRL